MKNKAMSHERAMKACLMLFMLLALIPAMRGDISNDEPHPQKVRARYMTLT